MSNIGCILMILGFFGAFRQLLIVCSTLTFIELSLEGKQKLYKQAGLLLLSVVCLVGGFVICN